MNCMNGLRALLAASCFICSGAGIASPTYPVLIKSYDNGFVPPEYMLSKRCEIYRDHVRIVINSGSSSTETSISIEEHNNFLELANKAAVGPIVVKDAPTDGPTTVWQAEYKDDDANPIVIPLKAEGSKILNNQSEAASTLVNILNTLCTF